MTDPTGPPHPRDKPDDLVFELGTATGPHPSDGPPTSRLRPRPAGRARWTLRLLGVIVLWALPTVAIGTSLQHSEGPVRHPYQDLIDHGAAARATVTGIYGKGALHYTFTIDGVTFAGSSADMDPQPRFDVRKIGDVVPVVYDVRDPNRSCACAPAVVVVGTTLESALLMGGFITAIPVFMIAFHVSFRHSWWKREWTGWPVIADIAANRGTSTGNYWRPPTTGGRLGILPGRVWFTPAWVDAATGAAVPTLVHTRRRVPLVGHGLHKGVYLFGNSMYGDSGVLWAPLPDTWPVDDVADLLTTAGFDVLRVPGPPPLAGLLIELPSEIRHQMSTSPELWA